MTSTSECRRPNFFLIGAAKCGTTSVANYLDQHPQIFLAKPKEPNYFAFEPGSQPACEGPVDSALLFELLLKYSVTDTAAYQQLFAGATTEIAVGEASVRYLYESNAAGRIAEYAPDAKLIAVLRDPVDRLHSHYHMNVMQHLEPADLATALRLETKRIQQGWGWDWHYQRLGMYAEQLKRYFEQFDQSQLLVLFHADLQTNPLRVMQQIFQHLGVSSDFTPNFSRRAMVGHTPRWRTMRNLIRNDNMVKTVAKRLVPETLRKSFVRWSETKNRQRIPVLNQQLRAELRTHFAEDTKELSDLLGCPIPW